MSFTSVKNNAYSKIATVGGIDASSNPVVFSLVTSEGARFPSSNFKVSIDSEILLVTSRTGDVVTATRSQEGTTMASHAQNADVELRITAGTMEEITYVFDKTKTTTLAESILLTDQSVAPTTPAAGYRKLYSKTDGLWYGLDSAGVESLVSTPTKATAAEVATGTEDAKFTTPLSVAPYANNSMSRQAIINGNFDVWQRGVTGTPVHANSMYVADRWVDYADNNGGTLPTLTRTRQTLAAGTIPGAFFHTRLAFNGAGTSLGAASYHRFSQSIENGTRYLCGDGKKVTVSFWARSDVANKKIAVGATQNYGTGGSPTAAEFLASEVITLTSSWVKYTSTITTNTLASKTFGTANDDYLRLHILHAWGASNPFGVAGSETYVGAGYVDIAQVQLCAGDVALPFQPKSYEEELRACQRYCCVIDSATSTGAYAPFGLGYAYSATNAEVLVSLPKMRIKPTTTFTAANTFMFSGAALSVIASAANLNTDCSEIIDVTRGSGMTSGNCGKLTANNNNTAKITFDAEL